MPLVLFFGILLARPPCLPMPWLTRGWQMSCFQKKPSNKVGPYGERDFLHQKDLLDPEVGG